MKSRHIVISKFLSRVLRHKPKLIGITLDDAGWIGVDELLRAMEAAGKPLSLEDLKAVVRTNDKQRFAFNEDETKIRANQGHSIKTIDLGLTPQAPPAILYHGTVAKYLESIKRQGLQKRSRQHVHLSPDIETATRVGSRRGTPILLEIDAAHMHADGYAFYLSANGVWLTDHVPPQFISALNHDHA
ncbi:MAG: RNA 2'-phosphotransferase [Bacteroidota bacterium]